MRATLSLSALYSFNEDLFTGLIVPAAARREVIIQNILIETKDLEVVYPDPTGMQYAITYWASLRLPVWLELQETLEYDYEPIYNYDRTEEATDSRVYEPGTSVTETTSGGDTVNDYTAGFNSSTTEAATPTAKRESELGSTNTQTASGTDEETTTHSIHAYGNIGVTTTQQMIEQQREIVQFSLEQAIIDEFKQHFCLMIY